MSGASRPPSGGVRPSHGLAFVIAGALLLALGPARSAEVNWKGRTLTILANEKPLIDFLREVVASQGLTAVIDPKIAGSISGKFVMGAKNILDTICTTNGLTWYYDGTFLYIDPASDTRSEVLQVSPGTARSVVQGLARLGVIDSRYPVIAGESSLLVTGPRRYVDLVLQATRLSNIRVSQSDPAEVRRFTLKYAWAADVRANRGGKEIVVPGVANVLRGLYGRKPQVTAVGGVTGRGTVAAASSGVSTRQLRLSSGETVTAPKLDMAPLSASANAASGDEHGVVSLAPDAELPQFTADPRMNAVWVRDLPDRMARYERLIESMDQRPQLIEIEVTIMDMSSDTLDSLGIDWRLHSGRNDVQIGNGARPPLSWGISTTESGQTSVNMPAGGVFSAAIGNSVRRFLLARVSALTKTGAASLVARPKVLVLNNTEALLENTSQLNVRVSGFQDAALFTITSGTSLRLTPLLVDEQARRSMLMAIDIVDGDLSPVSIDQIPIIRRRTINTQAMVEEGASLLIAGFSSVETVNAVTGVPLLSQLPLIGKLFSHSESTRTNMERLYLLTPRLVLQAPAETTVED